jgi:hypothetical protein
VRTLAALGLLMLAVLLWPSALKTLAVTHLSLRVLVQPTALGALGRNLATPGAGEQVLPASVRTMILLLRAHGAERYRCSRAIERDELIRQRLLEGALPIRYHPDAPYLVSTSAEPLPAACTPVASREGVILARCP